MFVHTAWNRLNRAVALLDKPACHRLGSGMQKTQDCAADFSVLSSLEASPSGLASPSTVLSGQKLTAGHLLQLAMTAMGQIVMIFSSGLTNKASD